MNPLVIGLSALAVLLFMGGVLLHLRSQDADPVGEDEADDAGEADDEPDFGSRARAALKSAWSTLRVAGGRGYVALTSFRAKVFYVFALLFAVAAGVLYLSYQWNGLFNTLLYVSLFLLTLTIFPIAITIAGAGLPAAGLVGKFHIVLGAFAFNHHYLVERDDRWEWCPGDEYRVWIDEEWHGIDGGFEYKSVLGWRPFGIVRYKGDYRAFRESRVDRKARKTRDNYNAEKDITAADGGQTEAVEMGGYMVKERPEISGADGTWLLDLRRVVGRGVRRIGDVEIIETAEMIIERGEVTTSRVEGFKPMITFIVSLILGVITAVAYTYMQAGGGG